MNKVEEYLKKIDFSPYGDVKITAFELRQIMTGFEKHLASNTEIIGNVSDCSEIYCMYDRRDAEIFCAFDDKERADLEHEECGAPYQIVKLHHGKRK